MLAIRGSSIIGVALLALLVWVFLAPDPTDRINRSCKPVIWTGTLVSSLTYLAVPQYEETVNETFLDLDYSCRYMVWNLFYGEQWRQINERRVQPVQESKQAPAGARYHQPKVSWAEFGARNVS